MKNIEFSDIPALKSFLDSEDYTSEEYFVTLKAPADSNQLIELAAFLRAHHYPCLVRPMQAPQLETLFLNTFYYVTRSITRDALRKANLIQKESILKPLLPVEPESVDWKKVSRAKINFSKGKQSEGKFAAGQLQVQRQFQRQQEDQQQKQQKRQQQQQQQSQSMAMRQAQLAARYALPKPLIRTVEEKDLNKIVNEENIEDIFQEQYPNSQLIPFWYQLVGENAKKISAAFPGRALTHVEKDALAIILKHQGEFGYGLVLDNLPKGFYLKQTTDKFVLCYDAALEVDKENDLPLKITLPDLSSKPELSIGDEDQLVFFNQPTPEQMKKLNDLPEKDQLEGYFELLGEEGRKGHRNQENKSDIKKLFETLKDNSKALPDRRRALIRLMVCDSSIAKTTDEWSNQLEAQLSALGLANTNENLMVLARAFVKYGYESVSLFLNTLSELKSTNRYDAFVKVFLKDITAFNEFLTPEGIRNLNLLKTMDDVEYQWWETLTTRHKEHVGTARFNELANAFHYFLSEVTTLTGGEELPHRCPFAKIKHLKTALNRCLWILRRAADKKEQLKYLNGRMADDRSDFFNYLHSHVENDGLDFGDEDAYYAMRFEDYKLATSSMRLSLDEHMPLGEVSEGLCSIEIWIRDKLAFAYSFTSKDPQDIEKKVAEVKQDIRDSTYPSNMKNALLDIFTRNDSNYSYEDLWNGSTQLLGSNYFVKVDNIFSEPPTPEKVKMREIEITSNPTFSYVTTPPIDTLINQIDFEGNAKYFYRFIGRQGMALPYRFYEQLAEQIQHFKGITPGQRRDVNGKIEHYNYDDEELRHLDVLKSFDNVSEFVREEREAFAQLGYSKTNTSYAAINKILEIGNKISGSEEYANRLSNGLFATTFAALYPSANNDFDVGSHKYNFIVRTDRKSEDDYIRYVEKILFSKGVQKNPEYKRLLNTYLQMIRRWDASIGQYKLPDNSLQVKNSLLHVTSLCATSKRQLMIGDDPRQIDALLAIINDDITDRKSLTDYQNTLMYLYNELNQLDVDQRPSLNDLMHLFSIWIKSNPEHTQRQAIFSEIFTVVKEKGNVIYNVLNNQWLRNQHPVVGNFDILKFIKLTSTIKSENAGFYQLLSLLQDVDEQSFESILALQAQINKLPEMTQASFLRVMNSIDITQSDALPFMGEVIRVVNELGSMKFSEEDIDQDLAEFLQKRWQQTSIVAAKPVADLVLNLIKEVSTELKKVNLDTILDTLKKNIPLVANLGLDQLLSKLKSCIALADEDQLSWPAVLARLDDLDKTIEALLNNYVVMIAWSALKQNVDPTSALALFIEKKSILPFIKKPLEDRIYSIFRDKLYELRVYSPEIERYILGELGEVDASLPLGVSLQGFSEKAATLNVFINSLIQINNQDHIGFKKLWALFEKNRHLSNFDCHRQLIEIAAQSKTAAPDEIMEIIYSILANPDVKRPQLIPAAIRQLKLLMAYQEKLSAEQFKHLLAMSFEHNVKNKAVFPLETVIKIEKMDLPAAKDIFDALMGMIAVSEENAQASLIAAINATISLLETNPLASEFIKVLLKLHANATVGDWQSYQACLGLIPENNKEAILKIVTSIANQDPPPTIAELKNLLEKLTSLENKSDIDQIQGLFAYQPAPSYQQMVGEKGVFEAVKDHSLSEWVKKFDLDPFNQRSEITPERFSVEKIDALIKQIRKLPDDESLSDQEQEKLARQITYINTITHELGIQIPSESEVKPLVQCTRKELNILSNDLLVQIQKETDPDKKEKVLLTFLAVLQEVHFRTRGLFPYPTQTLAALMAINHSGNILIQLNTGEGKSILAPLLIALEHTKEAAVDFCTAVPELARRDQEESHLFYNFFNIPSRLIDVNSPTGTYTSEGVNYSTMSESSLYQANAKLFREPLRSKKPKSLFIDELDKDTLDNLTAFNLANANAVNPYEWIYPVINDFVDRVDHLNINPRRGKVWSVRQDVQELKDYLSKTIKLPEHREQIKDVSNKQWQKWLYYATVAKQHRKGKEFIIKSTTIKENNKQKKISVAVPYDKNVPQYGSTREHGIQQFLHARLQAEKTRKNKNKTYYFPIDDESIKTASEMTKYYINRHLRKGGRLLGISATLGSMVELAEQKSNYHVEAFSIPPYLPSQLERLPLKVVADRSKQFDAIVNTLKQLSRSKKPYSLQPTIIFCEDANLTDEFYKKLAPRLKELGIECQAITGKETIEERKVLDEKRGHTNVVTFTTTLVSRGINTKTNDKRRPLVLTTYLENDRTTRQMMGRTARNGELGRYISIIANSDKALSLYDVNLLKLSPSEREAALETIYQNMSEDAAIERYYSQEMDGIQNTLLDHFQRWHKLIMKMNHHSAGIERTLLKRREEIINDLRETWDTLLEQSDPSKKYSNLYIRRNKKTHQLEYTDLDKALEDFEAAVFERWNKELGDLQKTYFSAWEGMDLETALKQEDTMPLNYFYLQQFNLQEALHERQYHLGLAAPAQATSFDVAHALKMKAAYDPSGAYLAYAGKYGVDEKQKFIDSTYYQLSVFMQCVTDAMKVAHLKQSSIIKDHLKVLQERIEKKYDLTQTMALAVQLAEAYYGHCQRKVDAFRIQPFTASLVDIMDQANRYYPESIMDSDRKRLMGLKETHFTNAYYEIEEQLQKAFAWRSDGKWYHQIERVVAKQAADAVLRCLAKNRTVHSYEERFKYLYQTLTEQKHALQNKFLLGILHENAYKTIERALQSLDYMAATESKLKTPIKPLRQAAERSTLFNHYLKRMKDVLVRDGVSPEVMESIERIEANPHHWWMFEEIIASIPPKHEKTVNALRAIQKKMQEDHPDLKKQLTLNHLIQTKHANWQDRFSELAMRFAKSSAHVVHTGFREYGELRIELDDATQAPQWEALGFKKIRSANPNVVAMENRAQGFDQQHFLFSKSKKLAAKNKNIYVKRFDSQQEVFEFDRVLRNKQVSLANPAELRSNLK